MIRSQIDLVGEAKFSRCHSELVGPSRFLEDFVTTRIFDFKREGTLRRRLMIRAVERERTRMDRLPRLVERLLRSKKNGNFVLQAHILRKFGRADRRIGNKAQPVTPNQTGWKAKLRLRSSAAIQMTREKNARSAIRGFVVRVQQFDLNRTATGYRFILAIRNNHAHRCLTARDIRLLPQNMNYRPTQDLGDRFRSFSIGLVRGVVFETIPNPMPH